MNRLLNALADTGDLDWSLVRSDFDICDRELVDSSVHHGRTGWEHWVADWRQAVHRLRARGRVSGVQLERTDAQLSTFADGLLARMEYLPDFRVDERSWALPGGPRGAL